MEKTTTKRSAKLSLVRLTPIEKEQIRKDYLASPFTSQSAYVRYKLLKYGTAQTAKKEMESVLLLGTIADEIKLLSKHFVQLVHLRKQEKGARMSPQEAHYLSQIFQNIQQINNQFNQNDTP